LLISEKEAKLRQVGSSDGTYVEEIHPYTEFNNKDHHIL
jgi:hypothetical protein